MKKKLNRRNKLAGWLIGAVCMVLLGGCGKKQDGTTEAVTTAEPAVVATNADAAQEPDLPIWPHADYHSSCSASHSINIPL